MKPMVEIGMTLKVYGWNWNKEMKFGSIIINWNWNKTVEVQYLVEG